jgi:hypothetical protein
MPRVSHDLANYDITLKNDMNLSTKSKPNNLNRNLGVKPLEYPSNRFAEGSAAANPARPSDEVDDG